MAKGDNKKKYEPLALGPLPVDQLNAVLGTALVPGDVRMSSQAHKHMAEDHPKDYQICHGALKTAVKYPHFAGQGPNHSDNFELIFRIPKIGKRAMLMAISMQPDAQGDYGVRSAYLISEETLDNRVESGRIKRIQQIAKPANK